MNRAELKSQIISWTHRSDLAGVADSFIDAVTRRLNLRLGSNYTLLGTNATNHITDNFPQVYLYGAMREFGIYSMDATVTQAFSDLYDMEVSRLNINAETADFSNDSPAIQSETEQLINGT